MTVGKMTVGKMTVGKMTVGKMTVGKMTVGKMTAEEMTCYQAQNVEWLGQVILKYGPCKMIQRKSEMQKKIGLFSQK